MKPSTFKEPNIARYIYKKQQSLLKIGSVVTPLSEEDTGLEVGDYFEVVGLNEHASLDESEVIYCVKKLKTGSWRWVPESWFCKGWVTVLQGDENDPGKTDISEEVAAIREKIKLNQQEEC